METIARIIDNDKKITEIIETTFLKMPSDLEECKSPKTARLIYFLTKRLNEIKNGIFSVCKSDNNYSANILLRVLIEHFLTAMYVQQRWQNENTDTIGEEYYVYKAREEEIELWESNIKIAKIIKRDDIVKDVEKTIYEELFPYLKEISKRKLKELNNHFKVSQIIQHFLKDIDLETIDPDKEVPELNNLRYFTDFVQLSTYVHCGPLGEEFLSKYENVEKRKDKLLNICEVAFAMSNGFKNLALICFWTMTKNKTYFELSERIYLRNKS